MRYFLLVFSILLTTLDLLNDNFLHKARIVLEDAFVCKKCNIFAIKNITFLINTYINLYFNNIKDKNNLIEENKKLKADNLKFIESMQVCSLEKEFNFLSAEYQLSAARILSIDSGYAIAIFNSIATSGDLVIWHGGVFGRVTSVGNSQLLIMTIDNKDFYLNVIIDGQKAIYNNNKLISVKEISPKSKIFTSSQGKEPCCVYVGEVYANNVAKIQVFPAKTEVFVLIVHLI